MSYAEISAAVGTVAFDLFPRPLPGGNGAWEPDGIHAQKQGLLDLLWSRPVLDGPADVAAEGGLEVGADTDTHLDQGALLGVQWADDVHCLGDGFVRRSKGGELGDEVFVGLG